MLLESKEGLLLTKYLPQYLIQNSFVFPEKNPSWLCPSGAAVFLPFFRLSLDSLLPSCFKPQ